MLQALKLDEPEVRYSAIVLFEEKNHHLFPQFLKTLNAVLYSRIRRYEIIIVSNGPFSPVSFELANYLNEYSSCIKIFELNKNASETVCFKAGFEESNGDIIISCGSYQQITENSLLDLLNSMEDDIDIVCSWRSRRLDSKFNEFQSNIFNSLVRKVTKSRFHDLSSSIKLFRRQVVEETELYGNMYRFLPILAARKGFKAKEIKCCHYHQECGPNGPSGSPKYIERISDVLTLYFISRFTSKPLRFFGFVGMMFLLIGIMMNGYVLAEKLFFGLPIGNRPSLLVGLILMIIGIQAASTGLLGEIIKFVHGRHIKEYTIDKII